LLQYLGCSGTFSKIEDRQKNIFFRKFRDELKCLITGSKLAIGSEYNTVVATAYIVFISRFIGQLYTGITIGFTG
jgi:hypothetical protein